MECSICMEAIEGNANISTTECGHSFHHQCLYKWHRRHTDCPLCRKEFGGEEDRYVSNYLEYIIRNPTPRLNIQFITSRETSWSRQPQEFVGTLDERDIQLVMTHVPGRVSHEVAESALRQFGGDIVDAIMYLTEHKGMPIPEFRDRERPPLLEPYVSRSVDRDRIVGSRRTEADAGYESC